MQSTTKSSLIYLPFKGKQGESTIWSLKNILKQVLLENVELKFVYVRTKLSSKFQIKDRKKTSINATLYIMLNVKNAVRTILAKQVEGCKIMLMIIQAKI